MHEGQVIGGSILLFDRVDRQQLAGLIANPGGVRRPSIIDLFVAVMSNQDGTPKGAGK